jgi:MFS superfamily sulfate permease-like transporter
VLGRLPGTTSWTPLSGNRTAAQVPGVLAVLFATPLWYANAIHFRSQMEACLPRAGAPPQLVVLDALGMHDLDYTGSRALAEVLDDYDRRQIDFALARAGEHAREGLKRSGLLARIGEDHLFPSVDLAVQTLGPRAQAAQTVDHGTTEPPPATA